MWPALQRARKVFLSHAAVLQIVTQLEQDTSIKCESELPPFVQLFRKRSASSQRPELFDCAMLSSWARWIASRQFQTCGLRDRGIAPPPM
jgi:hypothetical protein